MIKLFGSDVNWPNGERKRKSKKIVSEANHRISFKQVFLFFHVEHERSFNFYKKSEMTLFGVSLGTRVSASALLHAETCNRYIDSW